MHQCGQRVREAAPSEVAAQRLLVRVGPVPRELRFEKGERGEGEIELVRVVLVHHRDASPAVPLNLPTRAHLFEHNCLTHLSATAAPKGSCRAAGVCWLCRHLAGSRLELAAQQPDECGLACPEAVPSVSGRP